MVTFLIFEPVIFGIIYRTIRRRWLEFAADLFGWKKNLIVI